MGLEEEKIVLYYLYVEWLNITLFRDFFSSNVGENI